MRIPEHQRPELHHADEPAQVQNLRIRVTSGHNARKVEEFGTLVDLRPEALFQGFLCGAERRGFFDEVEVGEDADDFGEAVRLEDVQELERFLYSVLLQYN